MELSRYQDGTASTAIYPRDSQITALCYTSLGLAGEAGEIANKVKKIIRDDRGILTGAKKSELIDELGDVMWYVSELASTIGIELDVVAERNLTKLRDRQNRSALTGSGDSR